MNDRHIDIDNGWVNVNTSAAIRRLYDMGYSVGGYIDNGVVRYTLYRLDGNRFEIVHDTDNKTDLDNIIKLLLEPTNEG